MLFLYSKTNNLTVIEIYNKWHMLFLYSQTNNLSVIEIYNLYLAINEGEYQITVLVSQESRLTTLSFLKTIFFNSVTKLHTI
jgi:hypothetical protein